MTLTPTPPVAVGEIVLVCVDAGGAVDPPLYRPLLVTAVELKEIGLRDTPADVATTWAWRASGVLCCEPEDGSRPLFRGALATAGDPARLTGSPSRQFPIAYAEWLAPGSGLGQWQPALALAPRRPAAPSARKEP